MCIAYGSSCCVKGCYTGGTIITKHGDHEEVFRRVLIMSTASIASDNTLFLPNVPHPLSSNTKKLSFSSHGIKHLCGLI